MQKMKATIQELRNIIREYQINLNDLGEDGLAFRRNPLKWSRKEVLGHLIDSAQNNYRRFVCGQYDDPSARIVYDQEFWVRAIDYHSMNGATIITMWSYMNEAICRVLENMPEENYGRVCNTAKTGLELHSLEWLAIDYVKHLKHHMNQIFENAFDISYP